MRGYEPRWDLDYEVGRQAELWVESLRDELKAGTVEVKRDRQAILTGNVFVEYECLRQGRYQPSGIATTDARLWLFVLMEDSFAFVVSTDRLRALARQAYRSPDKRKEQTRGSHPTRGVIIPLAMFLDLA